MRKLSQQISLIGPYTLPQPAILLLLFSRLFPREGHGSSQRVRPMSRWQLLRRRHKSSSVMLDRPRTCVYWCHFQQQLHAVPCRSLLQQPRCRSHSLRTTYAIPSHRSHNLQRVHVVRCRPVLRTVQPVPRSTARPNNRQSHVSIFS